MQRAQTSRRRFLQTAGSAIAVPYVITSSALGAGARLAASERIVMATIGCGGQGTGDMQGFLGFPQVQMVAVCDVVASHRENARRIVNERYHNQDCKEYNDFREVLARPDIDAVLIGTPDHWHALITIEACKHGKDVYCEKPECLTIKEGRAMVQAVHRYGRVFSGGSQRVLGDYGDWPRLVRGGRWERSRRSSAIAGDRRETATSSRNRFRLASTGRCGWDRRHGGRFTIASSTAASGRSAITRVGA
jgi:Oxidoreductase family, NAD-binding Rossmann fold